LKYARKYLKYVRKNMRVCLVEGEERQEEEREGEE
jgi:hypothetical protein